MSKFKVGDKVVCVDADRNNYIDVGGTYEVLSVTSRGDVYISNGSNTIGWYNECLFELATPKVSYPTPNPPHKHRDLIIAWANGAEIEHFNTCYDRWQRCASPSWNSEDQYRIKPSKSEKQILKEELQAKAQELLNKIKELGDE